MSNYKANTLAHAKCYVCFERCSHEKSINEKNNNFIHNFIFNRIQDTNRIKNTERTHFVCALVELNK